MGEGKYFVSIWPITAPVSIRVYRDFFRDYKGGGVGKGNVNTLLKPIAFI